MGYEQGVPGARGRCLPPLKGGLGGKGPQLGNTQFCDKFSYVFCGFSRISPPIYPNQNPLFPNKARLDCWGTGRGRGVLEVRKQ